MNRIFFGVCLLAAACGGRGPESPLVPTDAGALAQTQAQSGTHLPFQGSFTRSTHAVETPPILHIYGREEGTATYLGQFTATSEDAVDTTTNTATGTFEFTAANGDRLLTTTVGVESLFTPPNISHVTLTATAVGGTGRFADANGTLTIKFDETIDFTSATATAVGTIEGHINLNK